MKQKHVAFTIVSRNYLGQATVLYESLKETNPGVDFYCVICDTRKDQLNNIVDHGRKIGHPIPHPLVEKIVCMDEMDELDYAGIGGMAERYDPLEFCCAVRPSYFLLMGKRFPGALISFIDSDVRVFSQLERLEDFAASHSFTLIPHVTLPPPTDGHMPTMVDLQRAGIFNMGYLGVNFAEPYLDTVREGLSWWQRKLEFDCVRKPPEGLFHDQKWAEYLILRKDAGAFLEPGYNVAYWNLHERTVTQNKDGIYLVNGQPLAFFHYSGYNPKTPDILTLSQDRYVLSSLETVRELCHSYAKALLQRGHLEWRAQGYGLANVYRPKGSSYFWKFMLQLESTQLQNSKTAARSPARGILPSNAAYALFVAAGFLIRQLLVLERVVHKLAVMLLDRLDQIIAKAASKSAQ